MTDAQYEVIKETFPDWAAVVEKTAKVVAEDDDPCIDWWKGLLLGLVNGMQYSGQCGDAYEFSDEALRRAREAARLHREGGEQ